MNYEIIPNDQGALVDGVQHYHIKANLPETEEAYSNGNGEGCFFLVDEKTKQAHDTDATSGEYWGILDNDSLYYPTLKHGERLPLEMRGEKRPVVPYDYLQEAYAGAPDYCPFCGNDYIELEHNELTGWGAYCGFCNCTITGYSSREAILHRWNNRFTPEGNEKPQDAR